MEQDQNAAFFHRLMYIHGLIRKARLLYFLI